MKINNKESKTINPSTEDTLAEIRTKILGILKSQMVDAAETPIVTGVTGGCLPAVLSETVDLVNPGWIMAETSGGTVVISDMLGNKTTHHLDVKQLFPTRVKRVWLSGTTVGMGIFVHF